jgi:hypothetical protein
MALLDLYNKAKKKVDEYFAPTQNVRVRDVVREMPKAAMDVGKSMFQGTINVATKAPKIMGEGLAYTIDPNVRKQYEAGNTDILPTVTKTTPLSMLADTARSMLEVGTFGKAPKWAASPNVLKRTAQGAGLGYGMDVSEKVAETGEINKDTFKPGMGALTGGAFGGAARPTALAARKEARLIKQDIDSLPASKRTTVIPASRETVSRELHDIQPSMGTFRIRNGKMKKVGGFEMRHKEGDFQYPEEKIVAPFRPKSATFQFVMHPKAGLSIEDVSRKVPTNKNTREINAINARKNAKATAAVSKMKRGVSEEDPVEAFKRELDATPVPWETAGKQADVDIADAFKAEMDVQNPFGRESSITEMKPLKEIIQEELSMTQKKPNPLAEYDRIVGNRPVVHEPKTIGEAFDTFVNTEANRAASKMKAKTKEVDPFERLPEGTSEILRHEPSVLNYDTWLRAIGMPSKERKKISFTTAKEIIHEWRVKNQPEYVGKQAEISRFKNFVGEFQNADTEGIRRGNEYLEKFGTSDSAKAEQIIKYLDQPGNVPDDIAPEVSALRNEQDELFREAQDAGLDVAYWKDYVTHIWAEDPETVAKKIRKGLKKGIITMDDISGGRAELTETPFFGPANSRLLKTYEAGERIGLHKLYNNPAQILAHRVKQLERAKVIIRNINALKESGDIVEGLQPGMKALSVQGAEGLSATPKLANEINNAFGNHEYTTWRGKLLGGAAATSRKLKDLLMSGGIPMSTINSYGIGMTLKELGTLSPMRAYNAVSSWLVANSPKKSRDFLKANLGQIEKIRRNDIQISTMLDNGGFVDKGFLKDLIGDGKGKGFFGGAQAHWDAIINEPTFGRYLPMSQIKFFNSVESRLLKKGYPPQAAEWIAAKELREGFGLGSAAAEAANSRVWKDWRETLFFAPTHRMNMLRVFGHALKSIPVAVGNMKNGMMPFTPGNQSAAQFLGGVMVVYAAYDWVNYKNTGHHLWDNPTGKKFEAYINIGDGEYISVPFMPSVATMPRLGIDVGERLAGGDLGGALGRAWQGTGSLLSKPAADVVMNADYFDRPIANEKDDPGKQWADRGMYLAKSYTGHPWIKAGIDAMEGKPAIQLAAQAVEAPVRFTTEDKLASSKFWDTWNKVEPIYQKYVRLEKSGDPKAQEYYDEHKDAIESYGKLNSVKGMYSGLKKDGEQDRFGSIVKNLGFAFGREGVQNEQSLESSSAGSSTRDTIVRKYELERKKEEFADSDKNFMEFGDKVLRKSPNGEVAVISKDSYESQLYSAKLTSLKKNENLKDWMETADKQLEVLNRRLNDPSVDELEKIQIENQIETLAEQYQKFNAYGGFKKPKAPKKGPKPQYSNLTYDSVEDFKLKRSLESSPKARFGGGPKLSSPTFKMPTLEEYTQRRNSSRKGPKKIRVVFRSREMV